MFQIEYLMKLWWLPNYEQGELTASYSWTGWGSRLQEERKKKLPVILEELREFISDNKEKTERCQHVTSWTWKD